MDKYEQVKTAMYQALLSQIPNEGGSAEDVVKLPLFAEFKVTRGTFYNCVTPYCFDREKNTPFTLRIISAGIGSLLNRKTGEKMLDKVMGDLSEVSEVTMDTIFEYYNIDKASIVDPEREIIENDDLCSTGKSIMEGVYAAKGVPICDFVNEPSEDVKKHVVKVEDMWQEHFSHIGKQEFCNYIASLEQEDPSGSYSLYGKGPVISQQYIDGRIVKDLKKHRSLKKVQKEAIIDITDML